MKREDCKNIKDIILVSQEEHKMVEENESSINVTIKIDLELHGHKAVAFRDMLQTAQLNEDNETKQKIQSQFIKKAFDEGLSVLFGVYRKSIIKSLKSDDTCIVIDHSSDSKENLDKLRKIITKIEEFIGE